jgi:hypothetical protein
MHKSEITECYFFLRLISLWKEYYRKTRQTIQVGSGNLHVGKLNQMPQEKNISK